MRRAGGGRAARALGRRARAGPLLRLGRGEEQSGGRTRDSILATALEAVHGAIYGEGGLGAVRDVIGRLAAW